MLGHGHTPSLALEMDCLSSVPDFLFTVCVILTRLIDLSLTQFPVNWEKAIAFPSELLELNKEAGDVARWKSACLACVGPWVL